MPRLHPCCFLVLGLWAWADNAFAQSSAAKFRLSDIQEVVLLPPVGLVSLIGQGNRATFSPEASVDASELLRQAIYQHDAKLRVVEQVVLKDSVARRAFAKNALRAIGNLERQRKAAMAQPQPWLDTVLAAQGRRFGLISGVWGFTRTPANRRALMARDLGIGLLSMGMLVPVTPNASVRIGVFIYDAQRRAIVYYKSNFPTDKDPLTGNGEVIERELANMLAKDFGLE